MVKVLGDRTLDEINNTRLFNLKQDTLPWKFEIEWMEGKGNCFSDATSRNPCHEHEISAAEALSVLMETDDWESNHQSFIASSSDLGVNNVRAITWEVVKSETAKDPEMIALVDLIQSVFPDNKEEMPEALEKYWNIRDQLYLIDGVVLLLDQVLIPPPLRPEVSQSFVDGQGARVLIPPALQSEVVQSLHSAHQGVSLMNEHAKATVYWPGISSDIQKARSSCASCNRIAPSQARTPPIEPHIPTTPFECVAADFFHYMGYYYLVVADRLSGWTEQQRIKVGSQEAGSQGLCKALRRLFVTFGVPVEISTDGGPEFIAGETMDFFKRWGIRHRLSSVSLPSSNGRAELAVKSTKRLLMDNVSPNGDLDNDKMMRALLTQRNTPDPGCRMSPAQILFGRPLRDALPYLEKDIMAFNNPRINEKWRQAWELKEEALKTRYVKTMENLGEHSRPLAPLRIGDHVVIQNQVGRFLKKWDRGGIIVEVKDNDQYVVKVTGTGRLTLRNRRFLRKYSHDLPQYPASSTHKQLQSDKETMQTMWNEERHKSVSFMLPTESERHNDTESRPSSPLPLPEEGEGERRMKYCPSGVPVKSPTKAAPQDRDPPQHQEPDAREAVINPAIPPEIDRRRSTRERKQRLVYDASTGSYREPQG